MSKPLISIVIPFYNEENRLEPLLSQSIEYLKTNLKQTFEIMFVNDGSTDATLSLLNRAKERFPEIEIRTISYPNNEGKGFAVKSGVLAARGEKIIVCDADFSIDLGEIFKLMEGLDKCEIVIGSKKHLLTDTVGHQKIPRRILGRGFTLLSDLLLGLNFTDITCGFRVFRSEAAVNIFKRQRMKRWSYDAESLFLAKKLGYRVIELPVRWRHVEGSKVSPFLDAFRSLRDIILIISNYYYGRYN